MHRSRTARLAVAALGLSIVTSMLAVIPAFAADTRTVHIGSAEGADGVLTTTKASSGEAFLVTVRVWNDGPQNINNVNLRIGFDNIAADESYSTLKPEFPVAFTDGTTVTDIVAGDDKCSPDPQPTTGPIVCDIGTLGKRKGFTTTLLITTDLDTASLPLKATVKVAENANDADNPGNSDTFAAEGNATVVAPSCGGLYGYLPAGQAKQLTTLTIGGCNQAISLNVGANTTNNDAVIFTELKPATGNGSLYCGTGTSCFGEAFEIAVNNGLKVDGYIQVTMVWSDLPDGFNINKAGVFHDGATKDVLIEATNKFACSAKKLTDCWTSSVVSGDTWTFTFRIPENGFIRGKG